MLFRSGADIPTTGQYEVLAFIPADVAADQMATGVTYKVLHRDGVTPLTRNQSDNRGRWMSLGTYWFNAHGAATVLITDYTTGPSGKRLYVDTVKWVATSANQPPAAPSNLRATAVSSSQIRLDWNDNSNNETSFEIYDGDKFVVSVGANTTSYTVGGLAPQSYHCHHLFARNSYGNSAWTDWGCTYTLAAGSAPAAPSNLRATAVSSSQIRLDWNDNSNNETSFEIYDGDKFVVSVGANTTSYTVGGLAPQSYHCHHLLARNSYGNSAWTDWGCTYTFAGSNSSNLARGQDANAANVEQDDTARFGPRNVTDGSTGTRWSSKQQYEGGSESDWIWVSLGGWYNVNRVILRWEAAYARMYTLKIWDGNTWVTVDTNNSGQGGVEQRTFATRNTCCVLMQGVKKANVSWGYSLWEFEVYGPVANKTGEEGLPARIDAPPGARMPNPAIDIPKPDTLPDLGK